MVFLILALAISGCRTVAPAARPGAWTPPPGREVTLEGLDQAREFQDRTGLAIEFEVAAQELPRGFETYRVGPGDEMEVLVERFEPYDPNERFELSSDSIEKFAGVVFTRYKLTVDPMGNIQMPLVGEIQAAGRSRAEIEGNIKESLDRYLVDPKVFVKIVSYTSYGISVFGKVGKPGRYEIKRPVTLSEAIALAGGLTNDGTMSKIYVARRLEKAKKFNITEIWSKGKGSQELVLGRDDIVFVPHRLWITWTTAEQIATVIDLLTNAYFRYKQSAPW
jgi:protein involved in polysaccharide export with SLBB domain